MIKVEHTNKTFSGKYGEVHALQDVSIHVEKGDIYGIIGFSGAGKSTLLRLVNGLETPDSGTVMVHDQDLGSLKKAELRKLRRKIGMVFQQFNLLDSKTVFHNIALPLILEKAPKDVIEEKVNEVLRFVELEDKKDTYVSQLSGGQKQRVAIAGVIAMNTKCIVMDEPTASLTNTEVEHLFEVIRALKKEGKGIVFISHKLAEIKEIGDRVSVLKDGAYVGTKQVSDVSVDDLVTMMVGRTVQNTYQHEDAPDNYDGEEVIFEVKNLSRKDGKVNDVSFKLHKGEIVGFSGLVGSGRSAMMNSIFGAEPKSSGEVFIGGKKVNIKSPYSAIKNGLAMVTENRRETGFFHNFDIKQNISILPFIKASSLGGAGGLISSKFERECAEAQKKSLNIKCYSVDQGITELSGGNQQKVILGKWVAADSQIIIFDEPTKGIDIGSKSEIYTLMRKLADEGKGVLVVSSELPELLAVCDTIHVFREGKIVKTFPHREATEENIIKASTADIA